MVWTRDICLQPAVFHGGLDEGRNVLLFVLQEPRSSAAISHVASSTEPIEGGNGGDRIEVVVGTQTHFLLFE